MKERSMDRKILISMIREELPLLSEEEQLEIAEILSNYIHLLDEGRIEEADNFILDNHKKLAKII